MIKCDFCAHSMPDNGNLKCIYYVNNPVHVIDMRDQSCLAAIEKMMQVMGQKNEMEVTRQGSKDFIDPCSACEDFDKKAGRCSLPTCMFGY